MDRLTVSKSLNPVCHTGVRLTLQSYRDMHGRFTHKSRSSTPSFESLILWLATGFSGIKAVIFVFLFASMMMPACLRAANTTSNGGKSFSIATTVVWDTARTVLADDKNFDGLDIVISGASVVIDGIHQFASLQLTNGASLTTLSSSTSLNLTISNDLSVSSDSSISVLGKGYQGTGGQGGGPGGGQGATYNMMGAYGAGGGHGGKGGNTSNGYGNNWTGGGTYGSMVEPNTLGSAGGAGFGRGGGAGGGAIRLTVVNNLVVDGTISANGINITDGGWAGWAGGGAGGSIWVTTKNLGGGGSISANGGNSAGGGGGGGGGRIALYFDTNNFTGMVTVQAGTGSNSGAGTIYARPNEHDLILNQQVVGQKVGFLSPDRWSFTGAAGQIVRLVNIGISVPGAVFDLNGPEGWAGFKGVSSNSDFVTLPTSGTYAVTVHTNGNPISSDYTFRLQNFDPALPYQGSSFDDFDWGYWSSDNYNLWQMGHPTSGPLNGHTGAYAMATILGGAYAANTTGLLISPPFLVPAVNAGGVVVLRFWQWYQYGTGDTGKLKISKFDGASWSDWENITTPAVTGNSTTWRQQTIDLSVYQGQKVRIGFLHTANSDSSVGAGWYIDDVQISSFVPTPITLGKSVSGHFSASGERKFYAFQVPAGGHLSVKLNSLDKLGSNELYVRFGALPSAGEYDYRFSTAGADQQVFAPNAKAGTWYVMAYSDTLAGTGDFTLSTELTSGIILSSLSPDRSAAGGVVTIQIEGAGFNDTAQVSLVNGASKFTASTVSVISDSRLLADFNLTSVPAGNYQLTVTQDSQIITLPFEVTAQSIGAKLETQLTVPSSVGRHAPAMLYVEYANVGDTPMPAPLLVQTGTERPILRTIPLGGPISADTFQQGFWTSTMPTGWSNAVQFLGCGETAGLLQPGEKLRIPIAYAGLQQPWSWSPSVRFDLGVITVDNTTAVDWASLKSTMRPPSISVDAWDAIWQNFTQQAGTTWGDYVRLLNNNAAYLRRLGLEVCDLSDLLAFSFAQADGLNIVKTLDSSVDAAATVPGLPLVFGRTYPQSISQRFTVGAFGRGWSHNWDYTLTKSSLGDVTITGPGGSRRLFQPDSRGGYFAQTGDHAKLTDLGGGRYSLRELNGLLRVFLADGKLDYVEDSNGVRITCQYTGGLLTRLNHSSGQSLQIGYSGSLIKTITDPIGRVTSFSYSGDHLTQAQFPDGLSIGYAYNAGLTPVSKHALASINYPSGVSKKIDYDARGRIKSMAYGTASGRVDFAYGDGGQITATDAVGNASSYYLDHRGLVAKLQSPQGRTVRLNYDSEYNLTSLTDPAGRASSFGYDSKGNVIQATDALGNISRFSYSNAFNRLATLTDAKSNLTRYTTDAKGNLSAITYANNLAERWDQYDANGNPNKWTNRRAQPINYTYNSLGQLSEKLYPDGSKATYTYDIRGNLETATNAVGTITLSYYLDDRLKRITYPGNRWLEYVYDTAGRRETMTDQLGYKLTYHYDIDGRLELVTDAIGKELVKYGYDTSGRLSKKTLGNGVYTTYDYDADGQLWHLRNFKPVASALSFFTYAYDTQGRRKSMETQYGIWTYSYDDLGQLSHAVLVSNDTVKVPNQDLTYVYDALGNRIRTNENGVTTEYTANNLNQYTTVGAEALTYDDDGSLTNKANGSNTSLTVTSNPENRVTGYSSAGGTRQYEYDALGFPSVVVRDGLRQYQVHDPAGFGDLVGIYDNSGALLERQNHAFGAISTSTGGTPSYLTFDGIGSASEATAGDASLLGSQAYRPFGERLLTSSGMNAKLGFNGEFGVMQEGDLVYMRARFYDDRSGRFYSPDQLDIDGGDINLFRYVLNSPIDDLDPLGLRTVFQYPNGPRKIFDSSPFGIKIQNDPPKIRISSKIGKYLYHIEKKLGEAAHIGKGYPGKGAFWHLELGSTFGNVLGSIGTGWMVGELIGNILYDVGHPEDVGNWVDTFGNPYFPVPPVDKTNTGATGVSNSQDPNELIGPSGYGTGNYLADASLLPYRINFENDAKATAPAHQVTISNLLNANLDSASFELTEIGFGDHLVMVPVGTQHFETTEKMTFNGVTFDVVIEAGIHATTGEVYARFQSLDPLTGLPPAVDIGFLPPEDGTGRGQGHVSYVVKSKPGLSKGVEIRNIANIVFDSQQGIATNQVDPHDPTKGTDPTKEALVSVWTGPFPAVTTGTASDITWASASVSGTVNPAGLTSTAKFEYGLTTAYGSTANVTLSPNNGTTAQNVNATISSLQAGATYHYRLVITNSLGDWFGDDAAFTIQAGPPHVFPYVTETFESDTGAWAADLGVWEIGVPTSGPTPNAQGNRAHEGTGVLATVLADNYTDDRTSRISSTAFVVPAADQNPKLRFWHWWSFAGRDSGQVQVSSDNGSTWQNLSPQYTADSSGQWTRATLDLSGYAGKTVRLGFNFTSESFYGGTSAGWYIDEVELFTGPLPQWPSSGIDTFEDVATADRWIADKGVWETGIPTSGPTPNAQGNRAHEGTGVLATVLADNYTDDRTSRISSTAFVVPAADQNPKLRFWHWWSFAGRDSGQVQVSSDNGSTWQNLSPQYTADSSGQWTRATLDLSSYAGRTVRLGFNFTSESFYGGTSAGWYIDEIALVRTIGPTVTSSLNPSQYGQTVNFTATISSGPIPTGSATFYADGLAIAVCGTSGTVNFVNGTASCSTSALIANGSPHTITANYSGDAVYDPNGGTLPGGQTVTKLPQTIAFGASPVIVYGGNGLVSATAGGSGNSVTFTSLTVGVCTVAGNTVTGVSVGSCIIAANQLGNANYNAAPQVTQNFNVAKGSQSISCGGVLPPISVDLTVGGTAQLQLSCTGGKSGNPVTFTSATTGICTVNGSTVTGVTAGICIIAANQDGNANYNAASQATQAITVGKGNQTIIFGVAPTIIVGGTGTVSATGGASGNTMVFSSQTSGVCTVSGSTVTGLTVGTCTIAANQTGNANYNAAPQATQSFGITAGFTLTVINANVTFGTLYSDVGGIVCGTTCSANFASVTKVTLTAIPVSGYEFTGWSGACTGYGNTCTVTVDAPKTVTAKFAAFKIHQPAWKRAIGSIIQGGG